MRVLIVADDLTGALDSAVAFAGKGLRVLCVRDPSALAAALAEGPEVLAVSTGSREGSVADAVSRIVALRELIAAHPEAILFKKIDSRLKGHVAAEIAALRRPGQPLLVCPALPRLGRMVREGAVVGAGVDVPLPIAEVLPGLDALIPDAAREADIDAILDAAPEGALLAGAAGLAEGLARRLTGGGTEADCAPSTPFLLAVGSRDPVTRAQLAGLDCLAAPGGSVPGYPITACQVIALTDGAQPQTPAEIGAIFADCIADRVRAVPPASLFLCGGETANAVLARLGIDVLRIDGECLPGLPSARALDGVPGLRVITKSGGFGGPDTLVKLIGQLVK
ncbi:hypothetical protein LCM17_11870 [Cereibacter sphaeroides]|nr:hypothetical protein [Cereibacter sphaeroides]